MKNLSKASKNKVLLRGISTKALNGMSPKALIITWVMSIVITIAIQEITYKIFNLSAGFVVDTVIFVVVFLAVDRLLAEIYKRYIKK